MKRIIRILVLAIALVTGITSVSAQTVQVIVNQKVPTLPPTLTSYLDDPFHYFNIQFIVFGAGSEGIDVFFDVSFTVNTSPIYVQTRPGSIPAEPLHLTEGVNIIRNSELAPQIGNRMETNLNTSNPLELQQLPEGTYQLCLDIYLWSDRTNPARVPITIGPCPSFDICYSGSAPELVSPLAGAQLDLNGAMVVMPNRKINFFWTPVVSNCAGNNTRFKYILKVVKVIEGQNYQDAIKLNPTAFSMEVQNHNYAVFDTLRDIKVRMDKGALYVAEVRAEQIKKGINDVNFIIGNDGVSQPLPFYWCYSPAGMGGEDINTVVDPQKRHYGYGLEEEDSEEGEESEGVSGVTLWEGDVEEVSELETILEEMKDQRIVGFSSKRRYIPSDGYYTIPMSDDMEVIFEPARHDALKDVSYTLELYDDMDGDIDSITAYEPLFSEEIELPERYNKMNNHEVVRRALTGWGTDLVQGSLYYMQLTSSYSVGYWDYMISDTSYYVNGMLAEHIHDTVSREFLEAEIAYPVGVFFQWGDDPDYPDFKTPQWKAPVDRSGDDIYDPDSYKLPTAVPEIKKADGLRVSWTSVKNVTKGDEVEYEVNVYELKPDQTPEEAITDNLALVSRTITDANAISDQDVKFFKVFQPNKTYVMTLTTNVNGESDTFYHFENGNDALPIVFKIVK